jgi:hypothetical protein
MKPNGISLLFWGFCLLFAFWCTGCSAEGDSGDGTTPAYTGSSGTNGGAGSGSGGAQSGSGTTGGGVTSGFTGGGSGIGGTIGGAGICADVTVTASRVKPWILFVVDRSGSTANSFPGAASRWHALYDALMAPGAGVIPTLESVAYFGMVLYDGGEQSIGNWQNALNTGLASLICLIPGMCPDGGVPPVAGAGGASGTDAGPEAECPRLIQIPPALYNSQPIDAEYQNAGPGGSTPTALALEAAYQIVSDAQLTAPDTEQGPQFVILCTDGEPNGCEAGGGNNTDYQGPINAVTAAAANGIKTFVVGIAVEAQAQQHLDELAVIGSTGSPAFSPTTSDELVQRISEIVGGAVGCQVRLNGTVTPGEECTGQVILNGIERECNGPDGWFLADESHIELQGAACEEFLTNTDSILQAGFPCGVFKIE